ncbi:MAG TPA: DUF3568 family protein [Candidatus Methylomirabilis sp.]
MLVAVALLDGCAALAVTAVGVAAGVGGGSAVSYSLDGIAYKTFTAPAPKVRQATLAALRKMDFKLQPPEPSQNGSPNGSQNGSKSATPPPILATGQDRQIQIDLEAISSQTTRIRVVAKDGIFFKDKATATEIIYQVADALDGKG